jgi:predicted RNA-binding protein with PUA-like domain
MNYWIFVIVGENAPEIFNLLLGKKNWGFWKTSQTRKKIEALKIGDKAVFYIGGQKGKYLAGEATLISDLSKPDRSSLNFPERGPLDGLVYFDEINLWDNKPVYLTDEFTREKLDFIKNKNKWGIAFRQSLLSISENEYKQIKQLIP